VTHSAQRCQPSLRRPNEGQRFADQRSIFFRCLHGRCVGARCDGRWAIAPYCSDLKRVADLAITKERFTSISAKPRDGNFADSSLVLTGWNDCSVYGARIYTCDSQPTETVQEIQQAQEKIFHDIQACLGGSWAEAKDRSSLGFIVLHHAEQPVSMTLSRDQTDEKQYVVRLILFGRSN
jgi:hypothetical protein